ncbi:MAG: sugar ABC transporter permease [Caldilineaceae bacterium]|nr:sugar ABC transporter permease [Caldilineaceae bacterium]HRJ43033.1 sugar ABC transporter permease [Caldilineaceae bacterium]
MSASSSSSPSWWTFIQRRKTRNAIVAGLFVLPAIVNFLIFRYIPILWAARASTWQYSLLGGYREWIGWDHYLRALEDPILLKSLQVTFTYVLVKLPLEVALALALALFTNQALRGMGSLRTIVFTPVVMSMVVVSVVWALILNADSGLLNALLRMFGLPKQIFLSNPNLSLPSIITTTIWKDVGFSTILIVAGLKGIPGIFYEAAVIDGANRWHLFRHITLPLLRRTLFFVVVTQTIFSFQVFIPVYSMTQGGPMDSTKVLVYYIYQLGFRFQDMGYAAAVSMILLAILLLISVTQIRFLRSDVEY